MFHLAKWSFSHSILIFYWALPPSEHLINLFENPYHLLPTTISCTNTGSPSKKHHETPVWYLSRWHERHKEEKTPQLVSPELLLELLIVEVVGCLLPMWSFWRNSGNFDTTTHHWLHYFLYPLFFLFGWSRVFQVNWGVK